MQLLKDIRRATPEDFEEIIELIKRSFENSRTGFYDDDQIVKDAHSISSFGEHFELVATDNGKIVAYILLTHVQLGDLKGAAIAPLVVDPEYRGSGLGEIMISAAENYCIINEHYFLCTIGEPHYFGRFGFLSGDLFDLYPKSKWIPEECFLFKELKPCILAQTSGNLVFVDSYYQQKYHDIFKKHYHSINKF